MDAASHRWCRVARTCVGGRNNNHPRETTLKDLHLTQRELDIMSVLWDLGEATATEVRDRVDPDLAYTSISSMIRTLELKGYVSHRRGEGKTHVYFPVIDAETAGESALQRVLDKIYGGSPIKLLAHLMDQKRLSKKELARMRDLLKRPPKGR
ncbi:MAG TPA: BlaI/MecI/CopY family transcriptional regulator [Gemmatimonadaceae bacterium]|nr:BlaI/MecI/CopY family transcriptional regulator [Gemmatimonadaceae bacterium]